MDALYHDERNKISILLYSIIQQNSNQQVQEWLQQQKSKLEETNTAQHFYSIFTVIPRFTGKNGIPDTKIPEFFIHSYTLDRLARTWWLLQLSTENKDRYIQTIEGLFGAADMNEQIALYGALPLLAWPSAWKLRTAEGIRSNIGPVLEAIMLYNPYPAAHLEEPAWNQLVMKAIFTDKPVHLITGLDKRANRRLADTLRDYAHERWAAGRTVNPMLWRLIGPFIDEASFPDIVRVWHSENSVERDAAILACASSTYTPALELVKEEISTLSWNSVAARIA